MPDFYLSALNKAENPEAYKRLAETGIMIGHSVTINGQTHRQDVGLPYHATVKLFDPEKDNHVGIHDIARGMKFTPPSAEHTQIEPSMFQDRFGNDVYVVKLHGEHADGIKANNAKFSHMGFPAKYDFTPHVSVDKQTWDRIVDSGAKTAKEAGIEFGPAHLKQGDKIITTYRHKGRPATSGEDDKLAASEKPMGEQLEKGFKQTAAVAAMAAAVGLATPVKDAQPMMTPAGQHQNSYSSDKMLRTIASVESSGGKFNHHRMMQEGIHDGEAAYGKYALMPETIRETIKMNRELKHNYAKAIHLEGQDLHHFMQDNPKLEHTIAEKHLARLEHHFGQNPDKIGYAWLNGVRGTYRADKEKVDIANHWHVKKIKDAYRGQK